MSKTTCGWFSPATFERAASGSTVPSWETIEHFIAVTGNPGGFTTSLVHSRELWVRARRATRAPYYVHTAPDPTLVSDTGGFLRALRHQHVWAGYPTPGEMELTAGPGVLPKTTTRRIIAGDALPVDPRQAVAFLNGCCVGVPADLERWLAAAIRAFQDDPVGSKHLEKWVKESGGPGQVRLSGRRER